MKNTKFIAVLLMMVIGVTANSQEIRFGSVLGILPVGNDCYSVINEIGTNNIYKTSPHDNSALAYGQVVQLEFDGVGTVPGTVQVLAPTVSTPLFCQKIETSNEVNSLIDQLRDEEPDYSDFVSYNSDHNVLVFKSWRDVGSLELLLEKKQLSYEYNQGNEKVIFQVFQQIRDHGWNMSANQNGNTVSLKVFEDFLEQSYPLSSKVLNGIIDLDEEVGLNPTFVEDVFTFNLPLSYTTEQKLIQSDLPNGIINHIIDANDDYLDAPNHVYQEFLNEFPSFYSLYTKLNEDELVKLESGMDPGDPSFDNDIVGIPFERLIMNDKHEVWIEGYLYKLYEDCRAIAMQNNVAEAYQDLAVLNDDGSPNIPNLEEDDAGLPEELMNDYVPSGYMIYNPQEFDPLGGSNDDPYYNTALQTYNILSGCPVSNFTYSLYTTSDLTVDFYDNTDWSETILPETSYIQYWTFGDGTGSFQDDPVHTYSDYGTYTVRLTSFDADCGCWHVHTSIINLLEPQYREGNPDCPISSITPWTIDPYVDDDLEVFVQANAGSPINPSYVTDYIFNFSKADGTPVTTINNGTDSNVEYILPEAGTYIVEVVLIWSDDCISPSDPHEFTVGPASDPPGCCDPKDKRTTPPFEVTYNDDQYKLKINDLARGTFGTTSWRKIQGTQKLYVKKNNKIFWKKQPAWHEILVYATYWFRVYIPDEGSVCDDIPYGFETYGRNCQDEWYSEASGSGTFYDKFGIDENSVTILHKVYLGGSMIDIPPTPGNCCDCYNSGGFLLFDEAIQLGECD